MAGCCLSLLALFLACVVWGTWLNYISAAHQDTCGPIRYITFLEPENGHYLKGHVFWNRSMGKRKSCEEQCLMERECVSINIGPTVKSLMICELSDSDHLQHPKDLKPRHDWAYKGTVNLCAINPCFNNGNCLMGYTDKGYLCVCQAGYTGENCEKDIDECSNNTHDCHENANCTNIPGSFNCSCRPGYTGDGRLCSDIDECSNKTHDCHKYANCTNIPGSFNCSCRPGYIGDGRLCLDIDECSNNTHDCHENANCANIPGSFNCSCRPGYTGDGRLCSGFNFAFTTLGTQGPRGPTNTSGYQGTTLQNKVTLKMGIQIWQVPLNGSYAIEAWGASGAEGRLTRDPSSSSRSGGKGAYVKGSFILTHGTFLNILVGQTGSRGIFGIPLPGGGGGGTFVILSSGIPLIVAGGGGGGGAPRNGYAVGDPGQITEKGSQHGGMNGTGGTIYDEGSPISSFDAGAGGGLTGNGASAIITTGGKSFENGGQGGSSQTEGYGGFGGGGAGGGYPGAGGGYSGGGVFKKTAGKTIAGGGGSLNNGINLEKKGGVNGGDGKVTIILVDPEL